MPESAAQDLMTLGDIAKELDVPAYRVRYAISTYRIAEDGRVGTLRYWTRDALPRIRAAVDRVARNRGERL